MKRLSLRFRSQQFFLRKICGETFYPNLQRNLHGRPNCRKPTEISVPEFCFKSVNFFLEGLKNTKIILFRIQELLRQSIYPKQVTFFQHDSFLGRVYMPRYAKAQKFKRSISKNPEPIWGEHLCKKYVFCYSYIS